MYSPGDSKNYSQSTELFEQEDYHLYDHTGYTFFDDLLLSLEDPTRPVINSTQNAMKALKMGCGIFQSSLEGGKTINPHDIDEDLVIDSNYHIGEQSSLHEACTGYAMLDHKPPVSSA